MNRICWANSFRQVGLAVPDSDLGDSRVNRSCLWRLAAAGALCAAWWLPLRAQDRLKSMPGYEQYQKMARDVPASVKSGALTVRWKDDGSSFDYVWDGK